MTDTIYPDEINDTNFVTWRDFREPLRRLIDMDGLHSVYVEGTLHAPGEGVEGFRVSFMDEDITSMLTATAQGRLERELVTGYRPTTRRA